MLEDVLAPMLRRPLKELREKLPVGSPAECADRLRPYRRAGAQRIFIWPLADEATQLQRFQERGSSPYFPGSVATRMLERRPSWQGLCVDDCLGLG